MRRRSLIGVILAAAVAPAVARAGSLMRVRPLLVPEWTIEFWNYGPLRYADGTAYVPENRVHIVGELYDYDLLRGAKRMPIGRIPRFRSATFTAEFKGKR